ncbi:flagellar basal body P-ring formation chaperone FlgA [Poseidonocella sedimentorum]|uniref:Flagella basal body P-ring formation protein FlgA n=1 Tax=Poseidonocella sedimentorum TaxID=871652 RepID=A0A1I6D5P0_9RHOB|nr:flagellar basal body P-ring formation chaperone FlgA [Poseidonocella sedimentorum]SFR00681.1 flagella basal body P-ring formation protein FlgA [Poseidonocella sedimentorum]
MRRVLLSLLVSAFALPVAADTVHALRTIRPGEIVTAQDIGLRPIESPGAAKNLRDVVGLEARVALYAGRPVHPGDLGAPTVVDRNEVLLLHYREGGLAISTEGRALGRGGVGDVIRVMNLSSRTTVSGVVQDDGSVVIRR